MKHRGLVISMHIFTFFVLMSCGHKYGIPSGTESSGLATISEVTIPPFSDDSVSLDLGDFRVTIFNYALYDSVIYSGDSIILTENTGFRLEDARMKIYSPKKEAAFEVYLAVKQTLTINLAEGISDELTSWNRQYTFVKSRDSLLCYLFNQFKQDSLARHLERDFKDIKNAVMKYKGEYITSGLDTVKSVRELPVELWISKSIIRIEEIGSGTRRSRTKFIVCKSRYGC